MDTETIECSECGESDWVKVFDKDYPEHRNERDRTIQTVYSCQGCGAVGKHFEHRSGGVDTLTAAMRA